MTRDPHGILWFNINNGRGGIGRLDPATQQIQVYLPPLGMTQTGGAATVDYDGKGNIWSSAPDGALRFDPVEEKFTEFKSMTFKTVNGTGITYGTAADRDGNGYWAEMILDTIGVGNGATGAVSEIRLAPVKAQEALLTPDERKFYADYSQPDFNSPLPTHLGSRPGSSTRRANRRRAFAAPVRRRSCRA
jgi:streptogramin lyase